MGIQILDQLGRVHQILNDPGNGRTGNIAFGGPDFDTLYVAAGDKVFRRRLRASSDKCGR